LTRLALHRWPVATAHSLQPHLGFCCCSKLQHADVLFSCVFSATCVACCVAFSYGGTLLCQPVSPVVLHPPMVAETVSQLFLTAYDSCTFGHLFALLLLRCMCRGCAARRWCCCCAPALCPRAAAASQPRRCPWACTRHCCALTTHSRRHVSLCATRCGGLWLACALGVCPKQLHGAGGQSIHVAASS
jgi:hypothetical protein